MTSLIRALVCFVGLMAQAALGDVVERRGTEPALEGNITIIDDAGVTIRSEFGDVRVVPWDRVRRVVSEIDEPTLESRMAVAVDLWRARSRVERNDTVLAEPLLERLFERYRGQTHETALVVVEGLLRCRLARADHARAVIPALEVGRLRRAKVTTVSYAVLPAVIDVPTALCPQLACAWLPTPLLGSLENRLAGYDAQGDEVVAALAGLYRLTVMQALGRAPPKTGQLDLPDHQGVELLQLLVECGAIAPGNRQTARQRLGRAIPTLPAWAEAWGRFHIGLSLLRDSGIGRRQQGMVSLIHLPARFGRSQPYLAGLALAYVMDVLRQSGDADAAAGLAVELQRSFPNHPMHAVGELRINSLQPEAGLGQREESE
ncbi:MAG: hypothetical protein O7F17_00190 [Planctomycetota bacterium]|nr:hypothetical protein [Planctomycetota bacterium]